MTESQKTPKSVKIMPIILALVGFGVLFRCCSNLGTLSQFYTGNVFRVGLIPWSDARGWVDGALAVMSGGAIDGYPAFRPLTPLFLSDIFSLTGVDYLYGMIFQGALLLTAISIAAWILRDVRPRLPVYLFLALLSIWRPGVETSFITEVPGMLILIPGFALLWRGTVKNRNKDTLAGIFLFGLNQAIRPWNILTLALLPLLAFRGSLSWKRKFGLFLAYVCCGAAGFGFHPLAVGLFNAPDAVGGNEDKALFGRVAGGSWMLYYYDPVITKARNNPEVTPSELRRLTYKRAWEVFRSHPELLLRSTVSSYIDYSKKLPLEFGGGFTCGLWLLLIFALLIAIEKGFVFKAPEWETGKWQRGIPAAIFLVLLVAVYQWVLTVVALFGIVSMCRRKYFCGLSWLILLYLAGVLLSIPLVGDDGGLRIKIGGDIILFLTAATGAAMFRRGQFPAESETPEDQQPLSCRDMTPVLACAAGALVIFIALPWCIKITASPDPDRNWTGYSALPKQLPPSAQILFPAEIERIWNEFPQPSFEKYNGVAAAWTIDYHNRDVIFAAAAEGLRSTPNIMQFWPLTPLNEPRSIIVRENRFAIISGIHPEQLSLLENKRIIIYGNLIAKPRAYLFATGYVMDVKRIGTRDPLTDGIKWVFVNRN